MRKYFFIIVLFIITIVGCDDEKIEKNTIEEKVVFDSNLNGTWNRYEQNIIDTIIFNNGNFENLVNNVNFIKGIYNTSNGYINLKITHVNGEGFPQLGLPSEWYNKNQFITILINKNIEYKIENNLIMIYIQEVGQIGLNFDDKQTYKYSINKNILTFTRNDEYYGEIIQVYER